MCSIISVLYVPPFRHIAVYVCNNDVKVLLFLLNTSLATGCKNGKKKIAKLILNKGDVLMYKKPKSRKNDYRKARAKKMAVRQASMMTEEQFESFIQEILNK